MSDVRVFVHRPSGPLGRYVREILWVSSTLPRLQILLPETILTLVLRQSGGARLHDWALPNAIVSGLQQETRRVEHTAGSSLIIVRFTEVGAPEILHDRADQLYDKTLPLASMLPAHEIESIQNRLADASDRQQQVLAIDHFLRSRIRSAKKASSSDIVLQQIEAAVRMIRNSGGRSSISVIARQVAMSQSALERHFRAAVGTTPKTLSRLARLKHVCRLWDKGRSLTDIAFEAGYSDQPHMIRDFRLFTGTSPEQFFSHNSPRNLPIFYK
jgi:AraC-like DNA-binding protein